MRSMEGLLVALNDHAASYDQCTLLMAYYPETRYDDTTQARYPLHDECLPGFSRTVASQGKTSIEEQCERTKALPNSTFCVSKRFLHVSTLKLGNMLRSWRRSHQGALVRWTDSPYRNVTSYVVSTRIPTEL